MTGEFPETLCSEQGGGALSEGLQVFRVEDATFSSCSGWQSSVSQVSISAGSVCSS